MLCRHFSAYNSDYLTYNMKFLRRWEVHPNEVITWENGSNPISPDRSLTIISYWECPNCERQVVVDEREQSVDVSTDF